MGCTYKYKECSQYNIYNDTTTYRVIAIYALSLQGEIDNIIRSIIFQFGAVVCIQLYISIYLSL